MNRLLVLLIGVALFGCTEISYKEPQPRGIKVLTKVPKKLQGKYLLDGDTVFLFDKGLRGKDKDTGKEEVLPFPSDSIVLKEYKGNYFVSYRDGNVWLLRILTLKKNGDISMLIMDPVPQVREQVEADSISLDTLATRNVKAVVNDESRKEFIEKLSKETPVIETDSHFIIDPSPKKLNKLLKKGFFKEDDGRVFLKKIN